MKKSIATLLAVILVLAICGCLAGNAESGDLWKCPSCGSEQTGNFCSNCGNPRPEDSEDITFDVLDSSIEGIIPSKELWGMSPDAFEEATRLQYDPCVIEDAQALKRVGVSVEAYDMDGFYQFDGNGLFKIVYLLPNAGERTNSELTACFNTLVEGMSRFLHRPDSQTAAVATWELQDYTVQIGTGRFKKYSGSDNPSVAVVFKRNKTSEPEPTVSTVSTVHKGDYGLIKEYKWDNMFYHYQGLVIKNISGKTKDFSAQAMFYDDRNELVGVGNFSADVVGNGQNALILCSNETAFHHMDYTITAKDSYYNEVQSFVDVQVKKSNDKAIIIAKNTGNVAAEFIEYYCLFLDRNKHVINYDWGFLMDDDSELKPGMTEMEEALCFEPFDSVEIYFTGRYR